MDPNCNPCACPPSPLGDVVFDPNGQCPAISTAVFLAGFTLPLAAHTIVYTVAGLNSTSNANPIVTLADLQAFLRGEVIPFFQLNGFPIVGTFSVDAVSTVKAQISGGCSGTLNPVRMVLRNENTGFVMLVPSTDNIQVGEVLTPLNYTVDGTIADRAVAVMLPATAAEQQLADGWAVVNFVVRNVDGTHDRVFVWGPGDSFALADLGTSPLRAAWAAVRDTLTGSPLGAFVGPVPGAPYPGPANTDVTLPVNSWVISPRIAVPVDIVRNGQVLPGFRLVAAAPALSTFQTPTVDNQVPLAPPPSAAALETPVTPMSVTPTPPVAAAAPHVIPAVDSEAA